MSNSEPPNPGPKVGTNSTIVGTVPTGGVGGIEQLSLTCTMRTVIPFSIEGARLCAGAYAKPTSIAIGAGAGAGAGHRRSRLPSTCKTTPALLPKVKVAVPISSTKALRRQKRSKR